MNKQSRTGSRSRSNWCSEDSWDPTTGSERPTRES